VKAALLAAVLASACAAEAPANDALPHDTYYMRDDTAGCAPEIPVQWCMPKLSLCADGTYGRVLGDIAYQGTYYLEGPTVIATDSMGSDQGNFTFDLTTRVMDGNGGGPAPWTVEPFVGDVACTYNTP
jgi:hypothetical protein